MSIRRIVIDGLCIALIIIVVCFIAIPIGVYGYINLSDALIMLLSTALSALDLFLVSGISCMLADIILGYGHYAIFTFIIKALEGSVILKVFKLSHKMPIAYLCGAIIMLVGYGITDSILGANILLFAPSVLANLPQAIISLIAASILYRPLSKYIERLVHGSKSY